MNATEQYVKTLTQLKTGELGLLRRHSGQALDETVDGFDLFAGLWWPLRQKSERTPRREVAWLIAKLYAVYPNSNSPEYTLAEQLRSCQPNEERAKKRFRDKFDEILLSSLSEIEPALQWALSEIESHNLKLDWAKLTNDLSKWERESTRLKWAKQFLQTN